MKYFVMSLSAVILVVLAGILFLLADGEDLEALPPPAPAASQVARQQPLAPTLMMGDQSLRAGAVLRDVQLTPEAIQAASRQLEGAADPIGTDIPDEAGLSDDIPDQAAGPVDTDVSAAEPIKVTEAGALPGLQFSQEPDQVLVTLIPEGLAGKPWFQGSLTELAKYIPPQDGPYTLDVWACWNGGEDSFSGLAGYRATLIYQLPRNPIYLTVDTTQLQQGYCAVLRAGNLPEGVTEVTAETDMGFTPTFYEYRGEMVALMPAKYNGGTGEYHITIHAGEESQSYTLTVTDGGFDVSVQQFNVDQSVADSTVNSPEANATYEEVTRPLKNMGDPEKYWDGAFVLPISEEFKSSSSTFGRIRIINGSWDQHAGIDYPAPMDTQVWAPNNGRVLYAGFLQLTGNTICIEHGFGLKSWFYHLNEVEVEAGQMVKTGDPIGKVGTTGFSTGPHLHFTMSVNNIYTNPEQYLERDPLDAG